MHSVLEGPAGPVSTATVASPDVGMRRGRAAARAWSVLLALGLGLGGCGEDGPVEPGPQPPRVEVGTGRHFEAIEAGDTLLLERGCQGSQHVFVSLRAWDLAPLRALVELSLVRDSDGQRLSSPYSVSLPFEPHDDGASALLEGLLLTVPDTTAALGRPVRLTASIEAASGERASDTRTVSLEWGPEPTCP